MECAARTVLAGAVLLLALGTARGCPEIVEDGPAPRAPAEQPLPAEPEGEPAQPDDQQAAAPAVEEAPPPGPQWSRPRFDEYARERQNMVQRQIADRGVRDPEVLSAMRNVPRHFFVPPRSRSDAHADSPLPIGHGQTISQPYIVALMTELLEVGPDDKVLEIGTGSGYQAAVLSELTPHVFSMEILEVLHQSASVRLRGLGYTTIVTRRADGYHGWPEAGPFDAVIVTAAAGHVPPPLTAQLKPGGRMAIPVGPVYGTQHLLLITKDDQGRLRTRSVLPVRFVPMTGRAMSAQ
jgi:protein-L-isoaspartate(D-aspartate) O-methyltransferase